MKKSREAYVVMGIVGLMYVVQVLSKIWVGGHVSSLAIKGDGWHNLADLFSVIVVFVMMWLSHVRTSERFPFGLLMVENIGEALFGLGMVALAANVGWDAICGWRATQAAAPDGSMTLTLLATAGNACLSLLVGRWQVRVGRAHGHVSMTANGQETIGDAKIGFAIGLGMIAKHVTHLPWLEYPIALLVAALIAKTGAEITIQGISSLMKRSIGDDHEHAIREAALSVRGIVAVADLKTFRAGGTAICIVKLTSRAPHTAHADLRRAFEARVVKKLGDEFPHVLMFTRFEPPAPERHRVAVATWERDGRIEVAPSHEAATRFLICDIEDGEWVRHEFVAKEADVAALLVRKQATEMKDPPSKDLSVIGLP